MSRFVYFDYRGVFPTKVTFPHPPSDYRYIVEVHRKDAKGVHRSPLELHNAAERFLQHGLSKSVAEDLINFGTPREIEPASFDKMSKRRVYSTSDGAIYEVIQEPYR